ncbi:MAG: thioredoxin [Deltaproteobacteria bacterium]|jgi:thioredoxin 1|nr:thioredoxin [Deltaproteobacteria bacterium]
MSENILVLTDDTFDDSLPAGTTLVDFWAPWCGPCQALAPVLEELSGELKGKLDFAKINVDENNDMAAKYKIRSIPCLIIFKEKSEVGRIVGHKDKQELRKELEKYV